MIGLGEPVVLEVHRQVRQRKEGRNDAGGLGADHALVAVPVPTYPERFASGWREKERFAVLLVECPEAALIVGTEPAQEIEGADFAHEEEALAEQAWQEFDTLAVGNDGDGRREGGVGGG